jgi:hypothetical protein
VSAQTARLAVTPAPLGRPGGPGLYHVKGMELPPYFQNIRNALIRSGHTPGDAYRITWGAIRRWAHGGGKVHPEVVAAAQAALADLAAKSAIAHAHSNGGGMSFLDLAVADALTVDPAARRQVMPPAERVERGVPEGGQYAPAPPVLGRYDTPERAAQVINGMGPAQRASVRSTTMAPPGFEWRHGDRLAATVSASPKASAP